MTAPSDPIDPGTSPWRMRTTVDTAMLDRVRAGLEAVLFERMYAARPRASTGNVPTDTREPGARNNGLQSKLLVFLRRCSLLGLMVALAFTASGGLERDGYRLDLILASYFIAALALSLLLPRIGDALRPERWTWPRKILARRLATRALERSRAVAPFDAQYDIGDAIVTYTRIKGDDTRIEWTRPLQGWYARGDGFTVLFEDTASMKSVVVLHEPSARFDELLARHGVLPLPPA